jgi:hypothetical protein
MSSQLNPTIPTSSASAAAPIRSPPSTINDDHSTRCAVCNRDFASAAELAWHSQYITPCVEPRSPDDMNKQEILNLRAELAQMQASYKTLLDRHVGARYAIMQYEDHLYNLSIDLRSRDIYKRTWADIRDTEVICCPLFLLSESLPYDNPQPHDVIRIKLFYDATAGDISFDEHCKLRRQRFAGTTMMRVTQEIVTRLQSNKGYNLNDYSRVFSREEALKFIVSRDDEWIYIRRDRVNDLWTYLIAN